MILFPEQVKTIILNNIKEKKIHYGINDAVEISCETLEKNQIKRNYDEEYSSEENSAEEYSDEEHSNKKNII